MPGLRIPTKLTTNSVDVSTFRSEATLAFWYRLSPGQKQSEKLTSTSFSLFSNGTGVNRSSTNLTSESLALAGVESCLPVVSGFKRQ